MNNKPNTAKRLKSKSNTPGSIYLRGNKLWYKYKSKSFSTGYDDSPIGRKMANEMLENLHIETLKNNGKLPEIVSQKSIKIHDAIKMWLEYKQKCGVKKSTYNNYKTLYNVFAENKIVSKIMIEQNIEKLLSGSVKPSTKNQRLIYISMLIIWLNDNEKLLAPLKVKIQFLKVPDKEVKIINKEEYVKLYEYMQKHNPEVAQYIELLWMTGMRKMEAMDLLLSSIDLDKGLIKLTNKIKGNEEIIPIPDKLNNKLQLFIEKNKNRAKRKEYLFGFSYRIAEDMYKEAKIATGLIESSPKIAFHDFRRSYATNIIEFGLPIVAVKDLMRHKKIDTTLKLYRKVNAQKLKDYANEAMNSLE